MDEVERAYKTFGLEAPASEAQIKQAYRDLVRVWHPDLYGHDARLQDAAEEKLKEINGAYQILLASLFAAGATAGSETPPDPETAPSEEFTETNRSFWRRAGIWIARAGILALCLAVAAVFWGTRSRIHVVSKTAAPPPGRLLADRVITTADDFVVDIFRNGERVPDAERKMVGEVYGATVEEISVPVHEGDWVVFNVANNRLRWGGAYYFGVAGLAENGAIAFVSDLRSGNWSCCDTPGDVPRFVAEADYMSSNAVHQVLRPWDRGDALMQNFARGWSGVAIWGTNRITWIKYRAPRDVETRIAKSVPQQ